MSNVETLKKELAEKEIAYRTMCDNLPISGNTESEERTKLKEELQKLKDELIAADSSEDEEDWENEPESADGIG